MVLLCHVICKTTKSKPYVAHGFKLPKVSHHFSFSRDLPRPSDQSVMWPYEQRPITISYYFVKFGGQRHYGGRDTIFLACHVI